MGLVSRIFIIKITKNISKKTTFCLKMLMSENIYFIFSKKATPWGAGGPLHLTFLRSKKKKMEAKEKKGFQNRNY